MRPGAELPITQHRPAVSAPTASWAAQDTAALHSPWQSPVPYLFGGLAAMLGLIVLALVVLACSYWKLGSADRADGEGGGEKGSAAGAARPAGEFRNDVVVIMAGDERPTFLARPASSRAVAELGAGTVVSCSGRSGERDGSTQPEDDVQNRSDETRGESAEHES